MKITNVSKYIAVMISLAMITASGYSANYYVDNAASGNNSGTSWVNAWNNFSQISWSSIKPGDVIYISGGSSSKTYHAMLDVLASGVQGSPLTITKGIDAGHNGTVILDGQMNLDYGIRVENRTYVTVKNLSVRNYTGNGQIRVRYSNYITVDNNDLYVTGHGGVYLRGNSSVVISNNRMTTPTYTTAQTDGIYSQLNTNNDYNNNQIIISNQEPNGHDDGIQMYEDNNTTIRNNYIEQNNSKTINAQGIYGTESTGTITVYNNICYGPNTMNSLLTLRNIAVGTAKLIAYHNTLVGGGWGTIRVGGSPNSEIKNNILVNYKSSGTTIQLDSPFPGAANINNNIHYVPNSSIMSIFDGTGKNWQYWRDRGYDANGYLTNPDLNNFSPQSGSSAIDKGVPLSSTYVTAENGVTRPQGAGWDIGAREILQINTTPVSPSDLRLAE